MREKYLRAGGTAEEWPQAWPSIRSKILEERTLAPEDYYNSAQSTFQLNPSPGGSHLRAGAYSLAPGTLLVTCLPALDGPTASVQGR